jgi:hypothetical protein
MREYMTAVVMASRYSEALKREIRLWEKSCRKTMRKNHFLNITKQKYRWGIKNEWKSIQRLWKQRKNNCGS